MQPIQATCRRDFFPAYHKSGSRKTSLITLVVMHDEEAETARVAAQWFRNPKSGGSAHLCVDDRECYRCLHDSDIPWGAPGANTQGFHIEQAGFARWSAAVWFKHLRLLDRAAYKAALHCHKFGIPAVFLTAEDLKQGKHGVTTHAQVSKAFGGDHWDPGPLWPRRWFMRRLRAHLARFAKGV